MNDPYSYVASLRVWHPAMKHEDTTAALRMKPKIRWSAGDARCTPEGRQLGGNRKETYWCTDLLEGPIKSSHQPLETYLSVLALSLNDHRLFLSRVAAEGGRSDCFVGLYTGGNLPIELSPDLLRSFAEIRVALSLDIYDEQQ